MKLGVADLPPRLGRRQVLGLSLTAGIGFTVALFIAEPAFPTGAQLAQVKAGIVAASAVAGVGGLLSLRSAPGREA